jgi:PPM family protein phosphatase
MADAIVSAGKTDKGSRPDNQDAILLDSPFFAVADGAGGHADGALAAQTAIDALVEFLHIANHPVDVVEAVLAAHWAVQRRAGLATGSDRMATTLTLGAIYSTPEGLLMEIGHVGDSRGYLISDGRIRQLTRDHTVVADLVERGELTPEAATRHPWRNALTRSIGQLEPLDVDRARQPLRHGDFVLLVSDGLNKHLSDEEIVEFVLRADTPRDAAEILVAETNRRGGKDNVSVVCVKVDGEPDATRFDSSASVRGNTATAELLIMPTEEIAAQK